MGGQGIGRQALDSFPQRWGNGSMSEGWEDEDVDPVLLSLLGLRKALWTCECSAASVRLGWNKATIDMVVVGGTSDCDMTPEREEGEGHSSGPTDASVTEG